MPKFNFLRGFGPAGTFAANVLVFLTTNWAVVVTTIIALWAAGSDWATNLVNSPHFKAAIIVFLSILWTYIGILYLIDRRRPRPVRSVPDYRYGLTFEGLFINLDPLNEESWLSFPFQIRNFSQAPIRYAVESIDLRIESRALPKPVKMPIGYLPRGGGKSIAPSKFKKSEVQEFFGRRVQGTVEISLVYGHPEEKPVRRLRLGLDITLHFPAEFSMTDGSKPLVGFGADTIKEIDEAIDANTL